MGLMIYFRYKKIEKPIVKVIDTKNQVILAFTFFDGEHLTLHPQKDGSILRTYIGKNKPKSTWDDERVRIAKTLGYKDPDRHGKYYVHEPLYKTSNGAGYHLVGRRIDFSQKIEDKEKYQKRSKIIMDIPQENCMTEFYLSTADNSYAPKTADYSFQTSLGEIFIHFEK